MAEFARTNAGNGLGAATAGEFIGRDVKFVKVALTGIHTDYELVDSDLELTARAISQYCTITIVGTPASDNCMFMVEGLAVANTVLKALIDTNTGGTSTVTVYDGLSGTSFA